jgi:hypothetical protein
MLVFLFGLFLALSLFNQDFLLVNEELLIFVCISLVLYFLVNSLSKVVNTMFYFRIEFIYFSFLNLLKLNIALINKILVLINVESLRIDNTLLNNLFLVFNSFSDFRQNVVLFFAELSLKKFVLNVVYLSYVLKYILALIYFKINFYLVDNNEVAQQDLPIPNLIDVALTDVDFFSETTDESLEDETFDLTEAEPLEELIEDNLELLELTSEEDN